MIFQLALSIGLPLAMGFALICILWPQSRPTRSDLVLKLSLSVGVGFGLLSCVYFLQLSFSKHSREYLFAEVIALFITLVAVLAYRIIRRKGSTASMPRQEPETKTKLSKAIRIAFFVALPSSITAFIFYALKRPHGDWDAWAVFNMKARFLFRAGDHWRDFYSDPLQWSGPDYPLLLSSSIAACWTIVNRETLIVPAAIAMLFTFASVGIVVSSISTLRGKTQGYLAGLVLLCTPYFIIHGANQYADIPVAFFYLSTIVLLTLQDEIWEKDKGILILAGLIAGLTAWTKNEGILFIILVIAVRFVVTFRRQYIKSYLRQLLYFGAGLAPVLLIIFYFKITVAAQNGYLAPLEESSLMSRILDVSRYQTIGDYLIKKGLVFGNWAVAIIPLLAFYLLLLGVRLDEKRKRNVMASISILTLMFLGFLAIYVISSRDVDWLIVTSLDRLISQLWPSIIFIFFLTVKTPEEALVKEDVMPAQALEPTVSKDYV